MAIATSIGLALLAISAVMLFGALALRSSQPPAPLSGTLELDQEDSARIRQLIESDRIADAVREYRRATGVDLVTAKQAVDDLRD